MLSPDLLVGDVVVDVCCDWAALFCAVCGCGCLFAAVVVVLVLKGDVDTALDPVVDAAMYNF